MGSFTIWTRSFESKVAVEIVDYNYENGLLTLCFEKKKDNSVIPINPFSKKDQTKG